MRRFRKKIMRYGEWDYLGKPLKFTKEKALEMWKNFEDKVLEKVKVVKGHADYDEMSKNPDLIVGEVEDLEVNDDGVYATFVIDDDFAQKYIDTEKIPNVSMGFIDNYKDHESGEMKGTVLQHLALVAEPYIKKLGGFIPLTDGFYFSEKKAEFLLIDKEGEMSDDKALPVKEPEDEIVSAGTEETTAVNFDKEEPKPTPEETPETKTDENGKKEGATLSERTVSLAEFNKLAEELSALKAEKKLLEMTNLAESMILSETNPDGRFREESKDKLIGFMVKLATYDESLVKLFQEIIKEVNIKRPILGEQGINAQSPVKGDNPVDNYIVLLNDIMINQGKTLSEAEAIIKAKYPETYNAMVASYTSHFVN